MFKQIIQKWVREVLTREFQEARKQIQEESASLLHDITYRLNVLKEATNGVGQRIHTSDLNIATHMIDGYAFTNNSPSNGSVAWTDVNIVYKGTTYTITNGNTANKYIWWQFSATDKTKLQTSNTKPNLTQDDILIGVNDGGVFTLTMAPGKFTPGGALMDGSVGTGELATGAVTSAKLAALAVDASKLADGAVTDTKLGANAVTSSKIASGAVGSSQLANGAVTSGKLGTGAVGSGNLADGAVTGVKLGAGAVAEDKLNVATHFLF
ncbi:hypothetical protein WD019_03185 [Fictibacillus sp. Mic-4]|uniref:hypothetical protein n=1 Tax=Fictibacillus sp. Mic-4 TaxID=3132826 RepID=UPI003CF6F4FC